MLGHLMIIDEPLGEGVGVALGMEGEAEKITPARKPIDLDSSPSLPQDRCPCNRRNR